MVGGKKGELKVVKTEEIDFNNSSGGFLPFDGDDVILVISLVMNIKFCGIFFYNFYENDEYIMILIVIPILYIYDEIYNCSLNFLWCNI